MTVLMPNVLKVRFRYQIGSLFLFALLLHGLKTAQWSSDEFAFLKHVPAVGIADITQYFDPTWGWYYRPLFLSYFALMRTISGDNPAFFLIVNTFSHALAATLITVVAWRFKFRYPVVAGMIFLGLTYMSQVVGWISCVTSIWALIGMLCAIICWYSFSEGKRNYYWGALGLLVFALLSKEEAAALPLLLLTLDFWKRPVTNYNDLDCQNSQFLTRHNRRYRTFKKQKSVSK